MKIKNLGPFAGACVVLLFLATLAHSQSVTNHKTEAAAKTAAGQGITFRIPKGVMPMEWKGFKGMLMLYEKRPGGIFIAYPDESESIADLRTRVAVQVGRMFLHDEKKAGELKWATSSIPSHAGDKGGSADVLTSDVERYTMQLAIYEREWNGLNLLLRAFLHAGQKEQGEKRELGFPR